MKSPRLSSLMSWGVLLFAANGAAQPAIFKQPSPPTNFVSLGVNLTNSASATTSHPPLSYQWQLNGRPLPGATNPSLALINIQVTNAGSYILQANDAGGSIQSRPWTVNVDPTFIK